MEDRERTKNPNLILTEGDPNWTFKQRNLNLLDEFSSCRELEDHLAVEAHHQQCAIVSKHQIRKAPNLSGRNHSKQLRCQVGRVQIDAENLKTENQKRRHGGLMEREKGERLSHEDGK